MNLRERLNNINNLKQDECWYITRQSLKISDLCYAAYILDLYKVDSQGLNFSDFFNKKAVDLGISSNHRMTNNCYYLGLLEKSDNGLYSNALHTDVYYEIKKRVNTSFNNVSLYEDIITKQIEKLFIAHSVDEELEGIRKNYKIHPTIYLYKILLTIGDFTGDYSISLKEFKIFVGTSLEYNYYNSTVSLILESRDIQSMYTNLINSIDQTNFNGNRFNLLFENLTSLTININTIKLKTEFIDVIRNKISVYESNFKSKIDEWSTLEFQNSTNSLFNTEKLKKNETMSTSGLNVIYFGSPGTGKSYKVDKIIQGLDSKYYERITFHPEFDNTSFIGGYKPISDKDSEGGDVIKYQFVPQAFTNIYERAWQDLDNQYYLVIEEINRGNCAEIFGEIFQLLDRTSNYTVSPTKELKEYLINIAFKDENHLGVVKGLKLPPNLSILATMNTSDQSLFPMDSAFKRRWDWEYIPICYTPNDDFKKKNVSFDFEIDIEDGKKYSWIKFIEKVNLNHIKNNPSLGMDKCIGNYFIKPEKDNIIALKPFINKVIFYLWNDVFKDEDNKVFEDNTSYEDFFPISINGTKKIKELFDRIDLKAKQSLEIVEDENQLGQVAENKEESES